MSELEHRVFYIKPSAVSELNKKFKEIMADGWVLITATHQGAGYTLFCKRISPYGKR